LPWVARLVQFPQTSEMEATVRLARRRRKAAGELFRFAAMSAMSALVTLGLPVFLHEILHVGQKAAVACGQGSVFLLNFALMRMFVFRSGGHSGRQFLQYAGSAAVFRGLEYVAFLVLLEWAGLFYVTALVITLGMSTAIKFVWYRLLFGGRKAAAV